MTIAGILKLLAAIPKTDWSRFEPSAEEKAHGMTVKSVCQCCLCESLADRFGEMLQCQANPGHIADARTGLFAEHTYEADPQQEEMP